MSFASGKRLHQTREVRSTALAARRSRDERGGSGFSPTCKQGGPMSDLGRGRANSSASFRIWSPGDCLTRERSPPASRRFTGRPNVPEAIKGGWLDGRSEG